MNKIKLFALSVVVLMMGLVSCSDDENENKEKQTYSCRLKIESETPVDSTLLDDEVFMDAVSGEWKDLKDAFLALVLSRNFHFDLQAVNESELKKMVNDLYKSVSEQFGSKQWDGYHLVQVYCSTDGKESHLLSETHFGNDLGANYKEKPSSSQVQYTFHPMDYADKLEWNMGYKFTKKEQLPENKVLVEVATDGELAKVSYMGVCDMDLNSASQGDYVYVCGKLLSKNTEKAITHVIVLYAKELHDMNYTLSYDGRTYKMAKRYGTSNGDLNQEAGGAYLYLMYTTDDNNGKKLNAISAVALQPNGNKIADKELSAAWEQVTSKEAFKVPLVNENGTLKEEWANTNKDCSQNKADHVMLVGVYAH